MAQLATNRKMLAQKDEALVRLGRQKLAVDPLQQGRKHFPTHTVAMQMLRLKSHACASMRQHVPMIFFKVGVLASIIVDMGLGAHFVVTHLGTSMGFHPNQPR